MNEMFNMLCLIPDNSKLKIFEDSKLLFEGLRCELTLSKFNIFRYKIKQIQLRTNELILYVERRYEEREVDDNEQL